MAHQYFNEDLKTADFTVGASLQLHGDEARHATKVSRLRVGETIKIGDGAGSFANGRVVEASDSLVSLQAEEVGFEELPSPAFELVQALAKSGRDERAVEQATEYGVSAVTAWEAERSIVRWEGAKRNKNITKWAKIAREAAKQSLRAHIPACTQIVGLSELKDMARAEGVIVLVLDPRSTRQLSHELEQLKTKAEAGSLNKILFVVGPEGGVSEREIKALEDAGALTVKLGTTVLRTSSAGSAALAVANTVFKRW